MDKDNSSQAPVRHGRRLPTTNQPMNAEPRPTVGPFILTLLLVAGIIGILALTVAGVTAH